MISRSDWYRAPAPGPPSQWRACNSLLPRPGFTLYRLAHRCPLRERHAALLRHALELLRDREPHVLFHHVHLADAHAAAAQRVHHLGHEHLGRGGAGGDPDAAGAGRSEEHTSELQSQSNLVCRLLLEKKIMTRAASELPTRHIGDFSEGRIPGMIPISSLVRGRRRISSPAQVSQHTHV